MKKGLGRGLDSIFADNYIEVAAKEEGIQTLRISQIEPKADQPRKHFDEEALLELSDSIKAHGLLQPIIVRESSAGYYQIIAGERRWRATKLAGLTEIPAIVMQADALEAAEIAIIENIQREDLNAYEEASAYRALMDQYSLTQEEVAEKVGKSRSAVANTMRLLELPDDVLEMLKTGDISAGHARAVLSVQGETAQKALARKIVQEGLSVRQAEQLAKAPQVTPKKEKKQKKSPEMKAVERLVSDALATKVTIADKNNKGKIEIEYYSKEQLTEIIDLIVNRKED